MRYGVGDVLRWRLWSASKPRHGVIIGRRHAAEAFFKIGTPCAYIQPSGTGPTAASRGKVSLTRTAETALQPPSERLGYLPEGSDEVSHDDVDWVKCPRCGPDTSTHTIMRNLTGKVAIVTGAYYPVDGGYLAQ